MWLVAAVYVSLLMEDRHRTCMKAVYAAAMKDACKYVNRSVLKSCPVVMSCTPPADLLFSDSHGNSKSAGLASNIL